MDNNKMMENYINMLERENDELKGVLKDMQEESKEQIKDNKRLRSEKKEIYNTMNDEIRFINNKRKKR